MSEWCVNFRGNGLTMNLNYRMLVKSTWCKGGSKIYKCNPHTAVGEYRKKCMHHSPMSKKAANNHLVTTQMQQLDVNKTLSIGEASSQIPPRIQALCIPKEVDYPACQVNDPW